jgi:hypothetical protein
MRRRTAAATLGVLAWLLSSAMLSGCGAHHPGERVTVFHRIYEKSRLAPMGLDAARAKYGAATPVVKDGKVVSGGRGAFVPTIIIVQDGGSYRSYELVGAP